MFKMLKILLISILLASSACEKNCIDKSFIPPSSKTLTVFDCESGCNAKFQSDKSGQEIISYYLSELKEKGWKHKVIRQKESENGKFVFGFLAYFKKGKGLMIDVFPGTEQTIVKLYQEY